MSIPAYSSYKDSGVAWLGDVPNHWQLSRIGAKFWERRQKVSDTDYPPLSVTKHGIVPQLETAAKTDDNDNRKCVLVGDFVINSRSDRKGSSGLSELDGSVSLINTVIRPDSDMVGRFIHHLFRSVAFQEEYYRYGKGIVADLWSTNYGEMKAITLAVPPTAEQTAIAAFLDRETDKIDALVEEQRRLITLLKEKRQAVISHAVTKGLNPDAPMKDSGIEWLGEIPEHWEVTRIKRISSIRYGIGEPPVYHEVGTPLFRATNVDGGKILNEGMVYVDPSDIPANRIVWLDVGDIIVVRSGAHTGDSAIVRKEHCPAIAGFDMVVKPNALCNPDYLQFCLLSAFVEEGQIALERMRAAQPHLNAEELGNCQIVLPPLDEQNRIAEFLLFLASAADELIDEAHSAVSILQERRAALISAAVTGKIDVRGLVAPPAEMEAA